MQLTDFTLFVSITGVVSASPGPVMLSCMSNGGRFGLLNATQGMLGACLGNILLMLLSALGVGLLISQNELLFNALKWLGAGYLAYMGIQIIRTPSQPQTTQNLALTTPNSLLLNTFLVAISNPKGFMYFGALFPQFINYQQPLAQQFLLLTATFLAIDLVWMFIYAATGKRIMQWLTTPKHQQQFNLISGVVLMAAGLFMALSGKSS